MCIENGFADNQRERGEDDRLENPEEDAGCEETGKVFAAVYALTSPHKATDSPVHIVRCTLISC